MQISYYPMLHNLSYKSYHAMQMYDLACTQRGWNICNYYTSLTSHLLKLNHMPETILMFCENLPNGKQLVVYRVTTLLFPGKQPIACLKRETTVS